MSLLFIFFIALNIVPPNCDKITVTMGDTKECLLIHRGNKTWEAREDNGKKTAFSVNGTVLTVSNGNQKKDIDFAEVFSISSRTDWHNTSTIQYKGRDFLEVSRVNNGAVVSFLDPEAKGQIIHVTWEKEYRGSDLLVTLLKAQKEQKKVLKQLFMCGNDLEKYSVKLYAKNSDIYAEYEGAPLYRHKEKLILLYAGTDELQLMYELSHELSHLILYQLAESIGYTDEQGRPAKVPAWYNEGMAEFGAIYCLENIYLYDYKNHDDLDCFRDTCEIQSINPRNFLESAMQRKGWKIDAQEYAAVGTFVEYLYKHRGGSKTIISVYIEAAEGRDIVNALRFHTHKSLDTLIAEWLAYLRTEYAFKV
jgi:hypothetical protein